MRSLIELGQLCGVFAVPPTLSTPNASDLEVDFAGQEPRVRKAAGSARSHRRGGEGRQAPAAAWAEAWLKHRLVRLLPAVICYTAGPM